MFLMMAFGVLMLLSILFKGLLSRILYTAALAALICIYFRMFSKDLYRRRSENAKYLRAKERVLSHLRTWKAGWVQRREYKFFRCPSCHSYLRVPRGRGKISIVCRKCGTGFFGKS